MNPALPQATRAFRTFEDLEVYQHAREFRKAMYAIAHRLPDFEKFALANQIRRAAVSVTYNLAEAHGRYHYLDQVQFVLHARGSLEGLFADLNVCLDEEYLPDPEVQTLKQAGWRVHNLINGYGRYLRHRKANQPAIIHEEPAPEDDMEW